MSAIPRALPADYRHGSTQALINGLEAENAKLRAGLVAARGLLLACVVNRDALARVAGEIDVLLLRPSHVPPPPASAPKVNP